MACLFLLFSGYFCPGMAQDQASRLDDVVVTATKTEHTVKDVPIETIVISKGDIEKKNSQNVMDLLRDIPGIQTASHNDVFGTYTWNAKMRGLAFDSGYALILIDGQRAMGCGQSGGMGEYGIGLNQIPVEMIERIEVVKGPGSALYGSDAMAGVINIITRKVPKQATGSAGVAYGRYDVKKENADGTTTDATGSRNMSKAYASFGNKITDKAGYYIHYNYEGADDITSTPLTSFRHSFLGKLDLAPSDKLDFSVKTELSEFEKSGNQEEESYRVSGIMDYKLAEDHTLSLKGYTYKWDFTHGYPGYTYGYKYGDVGFNQAELQYTWNTSDWNTLVVGGEAQIQDIDYIMENPNGSIITVKEEVKTESLFIQDEVRMFDVLTLVGGARYDDHSSFGDDINPKLSIMYTPAKDTIIRGSVGSSFKSPTIRQLYYKGPYLHGSFYAQSNPDLKPETAIGYGTSIEQWLFDNQMMLNLGYFRNDVDDMVIQEDTGTLYDGLPLMTYENVEKAWTQGIEFMCTAFVTRGLTVGFSYTYTDSENEETGKELTYLARHVASFSPVYDWEKYGMGVSARLSYSSKQYTDAANISQIDAGAVLDAKIYKNLSESAKLSFEMDDLFDSAQASVGSFYSGRSFTLKLDLKF